MKRAVPISVFALLALVLAACGGGGGGGGTSTPAVTVTVQPTDVTVGPGSVVTYLATVANGTLNSVTWSSTGGSIVPTGATTASFTAPTTAGTYVVTATSTDDPTRSVSHSVTVATGATTANVTGRVVRSASTVGIANVVVRFYTSTGAQVGQATTNATGNFSAVLPTTATRFHVIDSAALAGFYRQYSFNSQSYSILIPDCRAPLPALTVGSSVSLPTTISLLPNSGPPPPPPSGCF
ncbi:MAG: hypothetical protein SNJ74_01185 [Fimbriimonadaceae bacterium]